MSRKSEGRYAAGTSKVVPAQLGFLIIFNPSLAKSEDTFNEQVVFNFSRQEWELQHQPGYGPPVGEEAQKLERERAQEQENETLRQVGLAQGMVEFARRFSDGEAVDSVDTEKSRIVLKEVEHGWWVLASVDLTRLPVHSTSKSKPDDAQKPAVEYSSREVSPAPLLLQQLVRAHSIFLMHNAPSLDDLYLRLSPKVFAASLSRFWEKFALDWDVLLHGNPAVECLPGFKLAPGGELGVGVGEEEWGSGERAVLEGIAGHTDGVVDVIVSRFGPGSTVENTSERAKESLRGAVNQSSPSSVRPTAEDGIIFSGNGAISRSSVSTIASWMETIYVQNEEAYGVFDNSVSAIRRRAKRNTTAQSNLSQRQQKASHDARSKGSITNETSPESGRSNGHPGIPPPIVSAAETSLRNATGSLNKQTNESNKKALDQGETETTSETVARYLTLGYGSSWTLGLGKSEGNGADPVKVLEGETRLKAEKANEQAANSSEGDEEPKDELGSFLIGFKGKLEETVIPPSEQSTEVESEAASETRQLSSRINLRTVWVETTSKGGSQASEGAKNSFSSGASRSVRKLRLVVYKRLPFLFTFLFDLQSPMLTLASFYRSIHQQLSALYNPLLSSTSPSKVAEQIFQAALAEASIVKQASGSHRSMASGGSVPIHDLIYDPRKSTIRSSIPNIPEPLAFSPSSTSQWSRVEAINVHMQIINTLHTTSKTTTDIERSCKTSRGWWIVWMRLPPSSMLAHDGSHSKAQSRSIDESAEEYRQAFLVRRARDHSDQGLFGSSSMSSRAAGGQTRASLPASWQERGGWSSLLGMGGASSPDTKTSGLGEMNADLGTGVEGVGGREGHLTESIGIDARKYIQGLLSLTR